MIQEEPREQIKVFCQEHYDRPIIFLCMNCYRNEVERMCKICHKNREKNQSQNQKIDQTKIARFKKELKEMPLKDDFLIKYTQESLEILKNTVCEIITSMKKEYNEIKDKAENGQISTTIDEEISRYLEKRQKGIVEIEIFFNSTQKKVIDNLKILKYQNDFKEKFDGYSLLKLYERRVLDDQDIIYSQTSLSELFSKEYQRRLQSTMEDQFNKQQKQQELHQKYIEKQIELFKNNSINILKQKQDQFTEYREQLTELIVKNNQRLIQYQQPVEFREQFEIQRELLDKFRLFYYSQQSSIAELSNLGTLQLEENHDKLVSIYSIDYFPIIYDEVTQSILSSQQDLKFSSYYQRTTTSYQNEKRITQSILSFELDTKKGNYQGQLNNQQKPEGKGKFIVDGQNYYDGDWKNGMRDGKGIQILSSECLQGFPIPEELLKGKLTYDGEWNENKKHGSGIIILENIFNLIEVRYQNDKIYGCSELILLQNFKPIEVPIKIKNFKFEDGKQTAIRFKVEYKFEDSKFIYEGQLNNFQFHDGDGELEEQHMQGQIKRKLKGKWEKGILQKGKEYKLQNNEWVKIYDGEWKNNMYSGQGTQTLSDSDYQNFINKFFGGSEEQVTNGQAQQAKYVGQFKDGLRHGDGELKSPLDQVVYKGNWERDQANGNGQLFSKDNIVIKGNFTKSLLQGQVTFSQTIEGSSTENVVTFKDGFPEDKAECQIF